MSSPLRIAVFVNPFTLQAKGGGHGPQLSRALSKRGHVVRGFGAPEGTFAGGLEDTALRTHTETQSEEAVNKERGLDQFDPQAILAYDALSPAAWLGARAARRLGVPLVLVESGFSGSGPFHERFLRRAGEAMWGRYIRQTAQAVVALDPFAAELSLVEGFHADRIHVQRSGVNLDRYRPGLLSSVLQRHRVPGRILLYIGKIDDRRGLEILIDAFGDTVGQRSDWSLVLAGDGGSKRRLRARADRIGIASRVHWIARPTSEERPGLISTATLLAVPAQDEFVRGKQIPRALACGTPVLCSDLPRLRSYVEHDERGLLVPPGDKAAWVEAIRRAAGAPEARKRWSMNCVEYAKTELGWPVVAERFEAILRRARVEAQARRESSEAG